MPTKNAKISSQGTARAARDPPLGEGHEQPDAGTVEQGMGQAQPRPGETFSAEPVLPQKLGSGKFKIPSYKRASNQPGDHAASNMGGNEVASSTIIIRGRHSPPPRHDPTTHATLPTLQRRNDPTKPVSTVLPSHTASLGPDTSTTQPLDQDRDALQHLANGKDQNIEQSPHHPFGEAHGHTTGTPKQPGHREPLAPRSYPEGGSFAPKENDLRGLSPQEADTAKQLDQYTVENTPACYGEFAALECDRIVEFLAQYPLTEPRHGLLLTQAGQGQHLLRHNNTCRQLVVMLEALLPANLPAAERNKLDMLRKISQQNMLQTWPGERLQLGVTTLGFEGPLSEIAEFEARPLGFLITTKETLLEVCETLSNPRGIATATCTPRLAHFLDLKPAVTWIQFVLPEDLTHPPLQLAALHETFGPLGDINEVFLFKPRPEGFIIFNSNLHFPNLDGIMTPQRTWIGIHNPQHPLAPVCSATSPHYPTRRPDSGSSVTLVDEQHEAIVVAIEQKYWPEEGTYLIRIEDKGQLPKILYTILHRNGLKSEDNPYRIRPTALQPADGAVAFFFNKFKNRQRRMLSNKAARVFTRQFAWSNPFLPNYLQG